MNINIVKNAFGYHGLQGLNRSQKFKVMLRNAGNALGCLPVIGSVVGIARGIFYGYRMKKRALSAEDRTFCATQIARSVVEGFSLGSLFIVADVLVSLERFKGKQAIVAPQPQQQTVKIEQEKPVNIEKKETPKEEIKQDVAEELVAEDEYQEDEPVVNESPEQQRLRACLEGWFSHSHSKSYETTRVAKPTSNADELWRMLGRV